jgi:ATP-binding cassette subfamily B protein
VFNVLEAEEEATDRETDKQIESASTVQFENVDFSYIPEKPVIRDFSLNVGKGDLVAIVGPTGAGKTTIVNLLMRFYEIKSGAIKIDGTDIRDISRENLRSVMGMVLQDTWLFEGTVRQNIMYGNEKASEEEFYAAAKAVAENPRAVYNGRKKSRWRELWKCF